MEDLPFDVLRSSETRPAMLEVYDLMTLATIYRTNHELRKILNLPAVVVDLDALLSMKYGSWNIDDYQEWNEEENVDDEEYDEEEYYQEEEYEHDEEPNWYRDEKRDYGKNTYIDDIQDRFQEWLAKAILSEANNHPSLETIFNLAKLCIDFDFMFSSIDCS